MFELNFLVIFATSLSVTLGSIPIIKRLATVYNLFDFPDHEKFTGKEMRRVHTKPIPRLGGLAIVFGFFLSILLWVSSEPFKSIYIGSFALFVTGMIDDIRTLTAKSRFLIQLTIALFTVISGDLVLSNIWFTSNFSIHLPQYVDVLFSVFIIVGATNAVNLVDGLDGLAGGLVLIGIVFISMLHFLSTGDMELVVILSVPLAGSILGFLRYNTFPASIFMGDGGSNWLGFLIGALMLVVAKGLMVSGSQLGLNLAANGLVVPFLSILCSLSVPIVDTACVIIYRFRRGFKPWIPDKSHFHHSLLRIGLTHAQSVGAIYFLALLVGIAGIIPVAYPFYGFNFFPLLGIGFLFLIIATSMRATEVRWIYAVRRFLVDSLQESRSRTRDFLRAFLGFVSRYIIYGILAGAPLLSGVTPQTVGFAAIVGLFLLTLGLFSRDTEGFFQGFVIAVASSVLLTAINTNTLFIEVMGVRYSLQSAYNIAFIALFFTTVAFTLVSFNKNYLILTPTDFLMTAIPLIYLFIPEPFRSDYRLNIISLRSLVLFIAIRALSKGQKGNLRRIRTVLLFGLLYVVLTSLYGLRIVY
jgi:UDP-GlcNAc:undecaprenyl-phosphate GlcNAc-1-phosphate transferase